MSDFWTYVILIVVASAVLLIVKIHIELNNQANIQRARQECKHKTIPEKVKQCEEKITRHQAMVVSLLPPRISYYKHIEPDWEKDIFIDIAESRKDAFSIMRDYMQFNHIQTTDVTEAKINILDFDKNILEQATVVTFTCGQYIHVDYDKEVSEGASFLIREITMPKYSSVPSFEEWRIINNSGKRRYYERNTVDEYAYRDISRYLEAKSAKEGDD